MRDDTFNDLFKLIDTLDTVDDLNTVKDMLGVRSSDLAKETKSGLVVGEEVTISGSNRIDSGKIVKINWTRAGRTHKETLRAMTDRRIRSL